MAKRYADLLNKLRDRSPRLPEDLSIFWPWFVEHFTKWLFEKYYVGVFTRIVNLSWRLCAVRPERVHSADTAANRPLAGDRAFSLSGLVGP